MVEIHIVSLNVENYRTLKKFNITFSAGFNLVIGNNNVGKSNVLSALNKIINAGGGFTDHDISKINNPQQLRPDFELRTSDNSFSKKGNAYYLSDPVKNVGNNKLSEEVRKINLIYIDIQKEYGNLIGNVKKDYTALNELQKSVFDTQVNIDFSDIIGIGNNLLIKEDDIFVIDEYADISTLDKKSAGIQRVALLLCYINIFKVKMKVGKYVLLIDEPEANLHVRAQKKIFELLKSFSVNHQVIVSSHSTIFMQDLDLDSVNYITRNKSFGSTVDNENLGVENFKKIREALGLEISDTLFLNNRIIAVEGRIDVELHTYIYNRLFPNEYKYTFFTLEGADNAIQNIIALKQVLNREVTIILDNDKKGNDVKNKIRNHDFIKESQILFQPLEKTGEIEDLFSKEFMSQTIISFIDKNKATLEKYMGKNIDNELKAYKEKIIQLDPFKFLEVEKIVIEDKSYDIKGNLFVKHIIRELKRRDKQEFNKIVEEFFDLYKKLS